MYNKVPYFRFKLSFSICFIACWYSSIAKSFFKIVSKRKPSKSQYDNLIFAFNVCRYVKSNAIVISSNKSTVGIGSGQPSRLDSCQIAINKMRKFKVTIEIMPLKSVVDPQGEAIELIIKSKKEFNASNFRVGKKIEFTISSANKFLRERIIKLLY